MKRKIIITTIVMCFVASITWADTCMRYNNRKRCPGDSAFDVINLFGEPVYESELGLINGPQGCRKVELWVYQHKMRRWELTVTNGRVLEIRKIRLHRVR